jgi:hypothetical protein
MWDITHLAAVINIDATQKPVFRDLEYASRKPEKFGGYQR